MLAVKRHQRISWEELFKHQLFAGPVDLGIEKQKEETGYEEAKKILLNYLKNYLVKSYLLLNTNAEVQFAPSEEPMEAKEKSKDRLLAEKEVAQLTLRRNFAFLHLYVLALYLRNSAMMPNTFNYYMEFEFGLIGKAFELISQIAKDLHNKNKLAEPHWQHYQRTPQYNEFSQLVEKDFMLLGL